MMRIALIPLDDRPVCRSLPGLVAAVAGAQVQTPPADLLPAQRRPGDPDGLARWLAGSRADAAVVALETLGLGGLIASRLRDDPVTAVLDRWSALATGPAPVYAATVVQRTPDADDAGEEPDYWARYGRALHAYSAALHRALGGTQRPGTDVPAEIRRDFLRRRQRNHVLNQVALGLAADGVLDTLVVGADDTALAAVGTAEWQWLRDWTSWLELTDRVLAHPGADEIGAVLVARALTVAAGHAPRVAVACAEPDGLDRVARYEPVPVGVGIASQAAAAGATLTDLADADAVLVVHPPQPGAHDWATAPPADTAPAPAARTAALVRRLLADGRPVALADCALGNGADPRLVADLAADGSYARLAGFAGWNTAGNTVGSALATLVAYQVGRVAGTLDERAARRLLAHRLVDDHVWMSSARPRLRRELGTDPTRHDHIADADAPAVTARIGELLAARWRELGAVPGLAVAPGSVTLPWRRTYEIDFTLEETGDQR
ncbi:DUF4127 family protein [Micromonospora auratinigra]|uniref:DUF4127 domain-containing protein n=1 Tax=Micromonospora auratinigra TaxID=261654 RepID=A0A1A8ZEN6_9ACTN|nr:DUF4127 family protein [Micromonospora auratinigra]SBT42294.1 Protein of unknown function (DUF4127) [Micromonospora auratinigra]